MKNLKSMTKCKLEKSQMILNLIHIHQIRFLTEKKIKKKKEKKKEKKIEKKIKEKKKS